MLISTQAKKKKNPTCVLCTLLWIIQSNTHTFNNKYIAIGGDNSSFTEIILDANAISWEIKIIHLLVI